MPGSEDKEDNEKDDQNDNENEVDGVPALDAMKFQNKYLKARCDSLEKQNQEIVQQYQTIKESEQHWKRREEQLMEQIYDMQQKLRKMERLVEEGNKKNCAPAKAKKMKSISKADGIRSSPNQSGGGGVNRKRANRQQRVRKKKVDPRLKYKMGKRRNGSSQRGDGSWRKRRDDNE